MSSEDEKGEIEKNVFQEFIVTSGLPINPDTVEKRDPPEPDILCQRTNGTFVAFELVEICDSRLAKAIYKADTQYIRTSDPSRDVIEGKLKKNTLRRTKLNCYAMSGGE